MNNEWYARAMPLAGWWVLWVGLALLVGCREAQPSKVEYIRLPKDASHLEFIWPASDGASEARVRVPREDIDAGRIRSSQDGRVWWIFIDVPLPESTSRMLAQIDASTLSNPPQSDSTRKRIQLVELLRTPNNARMRSARFDQWRIGCKTCAPDGIVGGLLRFTKTWCPKPEDRDSEWARKQLQRKAADDHSPAGCLLSRSNSYLSNSIHIDQGDRGIDVDCSAGRCDMFMQVEGRQVYTRLSMHHLPHATEIADAIRSQISHYVQ